jgi:hypothetical protein
VIIDGHIFEVRDWSVSGFSLYGLDRMPEPPAPGLKVSGAFGLSAHIDFPHRFTAVVCELRSEANIVAFEFVDLMAGGYAALQAWSQPQKAWLDPQPGR